MTSLFVVLFYLVTVIYVVCHDAILIEILYAVDNWTKYTVQITTYLQNFSGQHNMHIVIIINMSSVRYDDTNPVNCYFFTQVNIIIENYSCTVSCKSDKLIIYEMVFPITGLLWCE